MSEDLLDVVTLGCVVMDNPIVVLVSPTTALPLGAATVFGPLFAEYRLDILLAATWAWELPQAHLQFLGAASAYVRSHPLHRLSFLCNNDVQKGILASKGFRAVTLNRNLIVDDAIFRPLPDVYPSHSAVYNARFVRWKRHELASLVDDLVLLHFYNGSHGGPAEYFAESIRVRALLQNATFVNRSSREGTEWLPPHRVNFVLNTARVGLCLSAVEGQMRASMEYMLAGLPIVSTPSVGGRDHFFDPDYCAVVAEDPREVRDAVRAMVSREIPRDVVRQKTLFRITQERRRFVQYVQQIVDSTGAEVDYSERFEKALRNNVLNRFATVRQLVVELRHATSFRRAPAALNER